MDADLNIKLTCVESGLICHLSTLKITNLSVVFRPTAKRGRFPTRFAAATFRHSFYNLFFNYPHCCSYGY